MNTNIKYLWALLIAGLLLPISACTNKHNWGDCPKEDRAKVAKIAQGSAPNKELLTVKLIASGEEFTYPEHTRHSNEVTLHVGDYFCTAEDYD
jgi:hypothetical protein